MRTELYTVSWNEAEMLPFFFRHYDPWIDRYVVYDNGSTDATRAVLEAHPRVEVRRFAHTVERSFVESHRRMHDTCWKESRGRADWVVITAIDEHLHVPGVSMRAFLSARRREGATYVPALGYQMVSSDFPDAAECLCDTRRTGAPFWQMNKLSLFDPNAIEETHFAPGRHSARPSGRLLLPSRDELLLLHYKYLDFERVVSRYRALAGGLGTIDRARRRGAQYRWTLERLRADWEHTLRAAVDIGDPELRPWGSHPVARWWRSPRAHGAASLLRKIRGGLSALDRRVSGAPI
jgi:hypothetical protein